MQRPTARDPPESIAQFLQFHEQMDFKGIPTYGPKWIVDMRNVRGYRQVMSRVPSKLRGPERTYLGGCITRILAILSIPGKYERLLQQHNTTIAETEELTPCDFGADPAMLSDTDVAILLAQKGMSVASAADAWQFCIEYVNAQIQNPDTFITRQLMSSILYDVKSANSSPPPGLHDFHSDQYARTVPSHRRASKTGKTTGSNKRR